VALQDQVDIDSVDFMNLMVGIEQGLGIDVPECDHPKVSNLDGCVAYLGAHAAVA
jgi:acyl carrier protein